MAQDLELAFGPPPTCQPSHIRPPAHPRPCSRLPACRPSLPRRCPAALAASSRGSPGDEAQPAAAATPGDAADDPNDPDGTDPDLDDIALFKLPEPITADQLDAAFVKLVSKSKRLRQKASLTLAANPCPAIIPRLLDMLPLTDTFPRRQAVQTLGVIGEPAVADVLALLRDSPDPTVRASCSKALAAMFLNYPRMREGFPDEGLAGLAGALQSDPDPVTKLATVMCLGEMGGDDDDTGSKGNAGAVDLLLETLRTTDDVSLAVTVLGALQTVGLRGSRERVLPGLKAAKDSKAGMEGGEYVAQMAENYIKQLERGGSPSDGLKGVV